jgi:hypothetical protein
MTAIAARSAQQINASMGRPPWIDSVVDRDSWHHGE